MMIHELTPKAGRNKKAKRVGRGPGSGTGKTCGRGHKGAGSRAGSGGSVRASREGGQMPFFRRIPKRGFSNVQFRRTFSVVNLKALDARFEDGDEVNPQKLMEVGLVRDARTAVKILGEGDLGKKLTVMAAAFSHSAVGKITKAGGSANVVDAKTAAPQA